MDTYTHISIHICIYTYIHRFMYIFSLLVLPSLPLTFTPCSSSFSCSHLPLPCGSVYTTTKCLLRPRYYALVDTCCQLQWRGLGRLCDSVCYGLYAHTGIDPHPSQPQALPSTDPTPFPPPPLPVPRSGSVILIACSCHIIIYSVL